MLAVILKSQKQALEKQISLFGGENSGLMWVWANGNDPSRKKRTVACENHACLIKLPIGFLLLLLSYFFSSFWTARRSSINRKWRASSHESCFLEDGRIVTSDNKSDTSVVVFEMFWFHSILKYSKKECRMDTSFGYWKMNRNTYLNALISNPCESVE